MGVVISRHQLKQINKIAEMAKDFDQLEISHPDDETSDIRFRIDEMDFVVDVTRMGIAQAIPFSDDGDGDEGESEDNEGDDSGEA